MTCWSAGSIATLPDETEMYLSSHHMDATIASIPSRYSSDTASDADSTSSLLFHDDVFIYSFDDGIHAPPRHPGRSSHSAPRSLASKRYLAFTQVKSTGHSLMPGPQAPRLIITDETIVPVCVKLHGIGRKTERRRSITSRLREQALGRSRPSDLKVMLMPRGEYLKYFAKDTAGNYIGTEPYRAWTAEELEEAYGRYRTLHVGTHKSAVNSIGTHESCQGNLNRSIVTGVRKGAGSTQV